MKDQLQMPLHYNADGIGFNEAVINHNTLAEGYAHPIEGLSLTMDNYEKFLADLKSQYDLVEYDFSESQRLIQKTIKCEDFVLFVSGSNRIIYIEVMSKSLAVTEKIYAVYKKYHLSDDDEINIAMTTFFQTQGHLNSSDKILGKDEINSISTLYYPYIDTDVMFQRFFTLQENILILTGRPGIGKSKMASAILKYAADNDQYLPHDKIKDYEADVQYVSVAYVKSTKLLADDTFWRELEIGYYDFVIMDDLDYFLTKRDAEVTSGNDQEKNQFLNQFLSFTDGIEKNKTKFIITTNQPFEDLDLVLLRKGRLFDILELRSLKNEEALVIWKDAGLKEKVFNKAFGNAKSILPADLGSEISKRNNTKSENSLIPYLKESGISRVEKAKKIKKVGV